MLITIPILTCFLFAVIYPLCFWITAPDPIKNYFHRFHLGIANLVSGIMVVVIVFLDVSLTTKLLVLFWKVVFFCISRETWKIEIPNPKIITIPSIIGVAVYAQLHHELLGPGALAIAAMILGGFVLCSVFFAMNLGHHYLNVHGLPISHLRRATNVFLFFLGTRAAWDFLFIVTQKINYQGDIIPIWKFIGTMEGFLLVIALFFGTLFPLASLYFVYGTLKIKNTQSTTGILYALLCSVLVGDITYKYYLLKYGLPL